MSVAVISPIQEWEIVMLTDTVVTPPTPPVTGIDTNSGGPSVPASPTLSGIWPRVAGSAKKVACASDWPTSGPAHSATTSSNDENRRLNG